MYPASSHVRKTFEQLVASLPVAERNKPQVLLLAGEVTGFRNDTDRELLFRQESNFYYLTGCTVPASFLLAAYQPGTSLDQKPSIDLFIPEANEADIMWSVPPPSAATAAATHDVTRVDHPPAISETLTTLLAALPGALVHTLPRASPLFPAIPDEYLAPALTRESAAVTDLYLLPALHNARLLKDVHEIEAIRHANAISSRAHEVVMRVLGQAVKGGLRSGASAGDRPFLPGEWLIEKEAEAEAIFIASCRREGAVHQAYLPIVAASTRAATLHYCCNDREFAWGPVAPHDHHNTASLGTDSEKRIAPQVLLIDAGCEWSCYASDITRTMPVGNGGKFTPEARAIYSLVLKMQTESFAMLKPGVHWDAVHLLCHRVLIRGFQELGIFHGGANEAEKILASGLSAAFFPHGLGHSLGLDVHDVPSASKPVDRVTGKVVALGKGREASGAAEWGHASFYDNLRLRRPLEAGMVVTVEPGIYFHSHLLSRAQAHISPFVDAEVLKRYEPVGGVRIEDVVHITEDGYENLTTVRSDVDWIESVCSGEI
ncbi:putative aminopeptidase P, N-terminal domain [Lyophyllum shimeji]|uniref:Aminopeptidase P, N-terminal domain n=1 Tax=Lyophyllum shimeji TaxID=47721 RepID=A0A9P3UNA5_LYOSH|nr:putative aminopeptidase P, N-terminal domain [Lyophyllum shimeji]